MVNVRREAPDQRLHHRLTAPFMVGTSEGRFRAFDWSIGGVGLADYPGKVAVGDILSWDFHLPFQGFDVSFTCEVEIKHTDGKGRIGAAFKDMGERETELLSHFADSLVRGSMTSVEDTILHIDMPVTPVSTEPDPNPTEDVPLKRRSLKVLFYSAFYAIVGVAIVIYLGMVIYTNFWRLEVETAVVSAPIQPIYATSDGRISNVWVTPFEDVETDVPLIIIDDPALRQEIEMAEIAVTRATVTLIKKQKELDAENARSRDYRMIALSQLEQINARVRALETQTQLALETIDQLGSDGASIKLNAARSKYAKLQGALEETLLLQVERNKLIQNVAEGRFFTGSKLEGQLQELQADVDFHWEKVRYAKDELLTLERQRDRLVLASPSAGQLIKLFAPRGTTVTRGQRLALFERDESRTIDAFLTQDEILEIGLGDHAVVYFPSLNQRADVIVLKIDRTSGYIDEMQAQYQWRGSDDRSARVVLGFANLPDSLVRQQFTPGLPAVVIFERHRTARQQNWMNADPVLPTPVTPEPRVSDERELSI